MLLTGLGMTSLMIYNKSFSITKTSAFHFPHVMLELYHVACRSVVFHIG